MKKIINVLSIASSIISVIIIICTFLTSYQFIYIGDMFSTYLSIQLSLAITMAIWAIKFYTEQHGRNKYIYTFFCVAISVISVIFLMSSVK